MHRIDVFPGPPWLITTSGWRSPGRPGHRGVDKGTPDHSKWSIFGAPIYSPWDGIVQSANEPAGAGQWIWVTHADGSVFKAFHLSSYVIRSGFVKAGTHIGNTGNTGASQGAHNHWELWENGRDINGAPYFDDAQNNGRFAGSVPPVFTPTPEPPKDWLDEASKDDLRAVFKEVILNDDELLSALGKKAAYWVLRARAEGQQEAIDQDYPDVLALVNQWLNSSDPVANPHKADKLDWVVTATNAHA